MKQKEKIRFVFFAICVGGVIGAFVWLFLEIMAIGQEFLFEFLPDFIGFPYLVPVICVLGGLLIGLMETRFHASPEELQTVMQTIKRDGTYSCERIGLRAIGALMPLLFGASIGPEAGLTGIIAGLCFWAGSRFRYVGAHIEELSQISLGATLGVIFYSPLFGFMLPVEDEQVQLKKTSRTVAYICSILGGVGVFFLLGHLIGGGGGIPSLEGGAIGNRERIFVIALIPFGVAAGFLYILCHKASCGLFGALRKKLGIIPCTVLGGLCLGLSGIFVPFSMFSGEAQMETLAGSFWAYTPAMLIGIGVFKILLTNICIQSGWKGGHFFPIIFAGISIGFGAGLFLSIDPVFAAAVVDSALLGVVMQKPVAVVLLLMLCFPIDAIVWMLVASVAGAFLASLIRKETA